MHVLMYTWEFPPRIVGGLARHVYHLSRALVRNGVDVTIITLEFPGASWSEVIDNVNVERVRVEIGHPSFLSWVFLFNHFMEKRFALLKKSVDIIHGHDWLVSLASISTKHFTNKPLVFTYHSTERGRVGTLSTPDSFTIDGLEWWCGYEASRIIVTSRSMMSEVIGSFKIPDYKISIIPNGIDLTEFNVQVDSLDVKRNIGIGEDKKLVLFVGRITSQKGVTYLIQAVPKVISVHPDARFIIVGDGWELGTVKNMISTMNLGNYVKTLGFLPDHVVKSLMKAADVMVIPSIYEPFGIVALEAMASGVPLVASDVGGLSEIVEHERTGLKVYPANPDSIAWGINTILSNPKWAKSMAQNALNIIREKYNWDAIALKTIEVYKKAMA
ncbi:MAG: glycosyltransferase family 4 protein [Thermoprotei archaeon]